MDKYEYNAISELVSRSDRYKTTHVSQADFPKIQGLVIPTARFTSLDFYGDNLPNSLRDAFSVKVTLHDSNIDHPEDTTFSIIIEDFVNEKNLSKDRLAQVKCALNTAFDACDIDAKNAASIPPTEVLKFMNKLDNLLAAFP